ncbi:MAG: hypothetical protein HKN34_00340 [Gammaproteobacteria bacterium]|nr:hypothetical protein [Gammaproteobacteria bacterium]
MSCKDDLQQKIRSTIPLSEVMQFAITDLTEKSILVSAPLAPNVGFAGSIYSLAVLTGWAMVTHIVTSRSISCELVVSKAEIRYLKPVVGDIECRCEVADGVIDQFIDYYQDKARSRIMLEIIVGDEQAALNATYHISSVRENLSVGL